MKNNSTSSVLNSLLSRINYSIFVFLIGFLLVNQSWAQISVTSGSLTYTQNFNAYAGSVATLPTGWNGTCPNFRGQGNGSSNSGGGWAYGSGTDFSIGYLGSGTSANINYSVSFTNNTGLPITKLVISYNAEQWRFAGGSQTSGYAVAGTGSLAANSAALAGGLNTSTCPSCGATGTPISVAKTVTLTGLNIATGAVFGLQWTASDQAGNDNGFSVDDFSLTAYNPTLTTSTLTSFGNVCLNTTKGPNSFTITGSNLTNAAITVGPITGYTFSATSAGTYSSSLSLAHAAGDYSPAVYVKLTPTLVQSYDGNIPVAGGAATAVTRAVNGVGVALPVASISTNSPLCAGTDLTLDGSASTGNTPLSYAWSGPASYNSTDALAVISPSTTSHTGTYTFLVTDVNTCEASQIVTVTVDPVITAPANISSSADAGVCTAVVNLGTPVTSTHCTVTNITNDAPAVFPVGVTTVTWSAMVGTATYTSTQTVTVVDNQNPAITAPANVTVGSDAGLCTASGVVLGNAVASDNCTGVVVTNNAPSTFSTGLTTVTWTATDASGNTSTATQTVTVEDNQNPTITAPANVTVNSDAGLCTASGVILGNAVTSDNCTGAVVTNDAPTTFNLGLTTVTWTVTDASGNTSTAVQTVTVEDNENPAITAPANVTVNSDAGLCTASSVALGNAVASDNCTGTVVTNDAPTTFSSGLTTVTWTATDASGNTSTATQTVTVEDHQNPIITAPANITVYSDAGLCTASGVTLGNAVASDNCTVTVVTNDAPSIFNSGATTVTWTVTDASGNTSTTTQTVTVSDHENPVITSPADLIVNADAGLCTSSSVSLGTPSVSDNCLVGSVSNDAPSVFNAGVTTVTWTVTDASGNTSAATQTVTVNSTIVPSVTISANPVSPICAGTAVTFTATPVQGGLVPSYQWLLNGNNVGADQAVYTNNALTSTDVVSCKLTSSVSCASPATIISNTITLTVNSKPTVTIVSIPLNATVCTGGQITLIANGASSYSWSDGIVNGTAFVPGASDTYTVTGTDANGCENETTINVEVQNCTGVEDAGKMATSFNVYPNPSNGQFNLSLGKVSGAKITMVDLMGKVKYTASFEGDSQWIDVKDIAKGVYIIFIQKGSEEMSRLITIE